VPAEVSLRGTVVCRRRRADLASAARSTALPPSRSRWSLVTSCHPRAVTFPRTYATGTGVGPSSVVALEFVAWSFT